MDQMIIAIARRLGLARISPSGALTYYFVSILGFGILHALTHTLKDGNVTPAGWGASLYFSVVTATTLGYGDVVPAGGIGRFLAAFEVLASAFVFAAVLNSAWLAYTDRLEAGRKRTARSAARRQEARRLSTYLRYLTTVYEAWIFAQRIVTNASDEDADGEAARTDWAFSDLQWMFGPSRSTLDAVHKTAIEAYYDAMEAFARELKFVLSHFDLADHPTVYEMIVEVLSTSDRLKARGALTSYNGATLEDGSTLVKIATEIISQQTADPTPENFRGNVITPVIFFNAALRRQTILVPEIMRQLHRLAVGPNDET